MMKKLLSLLLACMLILTMAVGCNKKEDDTSSVSSEEPSSDVTVEEPVSSEEPSSEDDTAYDPSYEEPDWEDDIGDLPVEEPIETLSPMEQRLQDVLLGQDAKLSQRGLYSEGNLTRIAKAIRKAKQGKKVTIAFYGGCNTSNNGASTAGSPYAQVVRDWWQVHFSAECDLVMQGISTLTSINACMRVEHDILSYQPDLVFLDFSVQDNFGGLARSNSVGFDNLIRKIMNSGTQPGVVTLLLTGAEQTSYSMNPKNCSTIQTASSYQKKISAYYDIPVISMEDSVWDTMFELVKVTEKTESPMFLWTDLASDNISMNDSGHAILAGMITSLIERTESKLNSISTTVPAVKTVGYFSNDKYMKGSMVDVGQIVSGSASGYQFDLSTSEMKEYGYYYAGAESSVLKTNTLATYISTYRHYISTEEKYDYLETYPYYLSLTIPKVQADTDTYFMFTTSKSVATPAAPMDFGPISMVCYDENDKMLGTTKVAGGALRESTGSDKFSVGKLPTGTTRIEFKTYTAQGTIRLLGIGSFES